MSATQQTLAQLIRSKNPGVYDDMDDTTLEKNVLAKYPQYSDLPRTQIQKTPQQLAASAGPAQNLSPAPKTFSLPWFKQKAINAADTATNALPAIGGMLGGVSGFAAGGPLGAIGGSGIVGMGGEAAKQLARRALGFEAPQTSADALKGIMGQGAIQSAIEAPSQALPFLAGPLQRAATTQYERALAPTTRINKAITQDIAPEMIRRGEYGSLEGMEKRAGQKIAELNPQLNQAYAQAGSIPTSTGALGGAKIVGAGDQVIGELEQLKQTYRPEGITAQPQAVNAIEGVQNIVKQYGSDISPDSLRRLRQIFEEVPAQRGAYAGADLSTNYTLNAQRQAADSIRGILNKNPDIGALNKEISFWLDVQRVTSQSGLRRTGQEGGLMRVLSPLAAGLAASTSGIRFGATTGLEAGTATALTAMAYQAMRSPGWRTASAVVKSRFADALARGDIGLTGALLARFGVTVMGAQKTQQQAAPTTPPAPLQGQSQ